MADLFKDKTLLMKKIPRAPQAPDTTQRSEESGDADTTDLSLTTSLQIEEDDDKETRAFESVDASEALREKVVCLFFSASWCAPCHHFVPLLKDVYTELKRRGDPLEVVFVSFDKTNDDMMDYYNNHHGNWLALPFDDPFRDVLAEQYSINMVPKLVVIQPDGDVITAKGRKDIQDKGVVCMRGWQASLNVGAAEATTDEVQGEQSQQEDS